MADMKADLLGASGALVKAAKVDTSRLLVFHAALSPRMHEAWRGAPL